MIKLLWRVIGTVMLLAAVVIAFYMTGNFVSGFWASPSASSGTGVTAAPQATPTLTSRQVGTPTMVATLTVTRTVTFAPSTPTPVSGEAEVIRFDRGAYGKTLSGATAGPKAYTLWARGGQKISVLLKTSGAAWTSLYYRDNGKFLYDKAVQGSTVQGTLPADGDYILVVFPGDGRQTSYELSVEIR